MFVSWIICIGTYLVSDTMTLTMDVILTRDVAFDNLLPTTGSIKNK